MSTCDVYKGPIKLGSGSISNGATSITSYTSTGAKDEARKNVTVVITSSTHVGSSFQTRVLVDGGTSLTIKDSNPYAT